MRRPPRENSFQNFVPTGKIHASASDVSMRAPLGNSTQRRLAEPSLQSAKAGSYACTSDAMRSGLAGSNNPVCDRRSGRAASTAGSGASQRR